MDPLAVEPEAGESIPHESSPFTPEKLTRIDRIVVARQTALGARGPVGTRGPVGAVVSSTGTAALDAGATSTTTTTVSLPPSLAQVSPLTPAL